MERIFKEDQQPRLASDKMSPEAFKKYWGDINQRDAHRRREVGTLLANGELRTGRDYERASLIFQHGSASADYLLAHTLAVIAVAKGDAKAVWIATATMDRYLKSIGQPQIYGTQFSAA